MSPVDWTLSGILGFLLWFFIKKYMGSLEEKVSSLENKVEEVVSGATTSIDTLSEVVDLKLGDTIDELNKLKIEFATITTELKVKVEGLSTDIEGVRFTNIHDFMEIKENNEDAFGKVILLEKQAQQNQVNITQLTKVLTLLNEKLDRIK